ncbi:SH3 domain-containing protein [Clostridium senegalense]|uniref:SH3 domain-containing protein n=1 Tax=Clostridium senegalense TaxID=1465809 RepID=UPI000288E83B|nr:SH3 domain-containing protein [Clostridium senegalense]
MAKKKIVSSLIISGILAATMLGTPSIAMAASTENNQNTNVEEGSIIQPREAGSFIVTADIGANIRSGPGTNYSILTAVPRGTILWRMNYGPTNGWYKVRTDNGRYVGWIHQSTGYPN